MRNAQTGRRRGRGNNPRPPQGSREMGNRTEPRQRGNAIQLLEKYNNLAREAHQQGERVQAEYYLQYADHYHRVVAEMRSRQDERPAQNAQQGDRQPRERQDRYERDDRDERFDGGDSRDDPDDDINDEEDIADNRPAPVPAEDESDDEGALRTLSRGARQGDDDEPRARDDAGEAPRRPRGRPRRAPREPVEA